MTNKKMIEGLKRYGCTQPEGYLLPHEVEAIIKALEELEYLRKLGHSRTPPT